jgi:peroxiredoxin Q/BCP
MLKPGASVPDISLLDDSGKAISLTDFQGQRLIIYFYSRDNTSGCTNEALSIEAVRPELEELGYAIIGVSPDSVKSHINFKYKNSLGFKLLSDPDREMAKAFGVYGEKKMYGKTVMGIMRTTFVADEQGKIIKVYEKVKAAGHGQQLLSDLNS